LIAVALYIVGWLLVNALPSLMPFIIGLVLAYLLLPLVNRLDRKMPRWLAILTVYAGAIVLVVILIAYIAPVVSDQIERLIDNFPRFIERLRVLGRDLFQQYQNSVPASIRVPLEQGVRDGLGTLQSNISSYIQGIGGFLFAQVLQIINTVTFLVGFLIIPIWLFYILNDVSKGSAFIDRLLHTRARPDFWNIWGIINHVFSDYIRGQLILGVAVGVMVAGDHRRHHRADPDYRPDHRRHPWRDHRVHRLAGHRAGGAAGVCGCPAAGEQPAGAADHRRECWHPPRDPHRCADRDGPCLRPARRGAGRPALGNRPRSLRLYLPAAGWQFA
jgi:hypothetical protein